jgi:hypothetical protein
MAEIAATMTSVRSTGGARRVATRARDGRRGRAGRPAHQAAASRDREARGIKPYNQSIGYGSAIRLDVQRARVRGDREAAQCQVPVRAQYIRVMFDEITRILNHLMWLGSRPRIGAMTVFLYCFREREDEC